MSGEAAEMGMGMGEGRRCGGGDFEKVTRKCYMCVRERRSHSETRSPRWGMSS